MGWWAHLSRWPLRRVADHLSRSGSTTLLSAAAAAGRLWLAARALRPVWELTAAAAASHQKRRHVDDAAAAAVAVVVVVVVLSHPLRHCHTVRRC